MSQVAFRSTIYRQRIRSSTAFETIKEPEQIENHDPVHYTFGDEARNSLQFNINDFDDAIMRDFDKNYDMIDSPVCFMNDEDELNKKSENDQCDDDDDLCSINSYKSEYSSIHDAEYKVLENFQ